MPEISSSVVLVLGGGGQVGFEICKKILSKKPSKMIVSTLTQKEGEKLIKDLKKLSQNTKLELEWGNIFLRREIKDNTMELTNTKIAQTIVNDVFDGLNEDTLSKSFLFSIFEKHRPTLVIDAINTATALAYLDVYSQINRENNEDKWLHLAASLELPQLIRHIQVLYHGFKIANTQQYLKIGTSGTGGLGLTLPFTHGENEVPSRLLMNKAGIAGAHTMLLWILARTPGAPIIKELKITSLIGWKKIGFGDIETQKGNIEIYDCPVENALSVQKALQAGGGENQEKKLKGAWIDTGENGLFTRDMFAAITHPEGMGLITPKEIAELAIRELEGENTGKEIIHNLDQASVGPTFTGQGQREHALDELKKLQKEEVASISTLGPLTSKILWEGLILKKALQGLDKVSKTDTHEIQEKTFEIIKTNKTLRTQIISIGIPILLPTGKMLCGPAINVPIKKTRNITVNDIEKWAAIGWVDLRFKNWSRWRSWLQKYEDNVRYEYPKEKERKFEVGEVCGWIFANELGGLRLKR